MSLVAELQRRSVFKVGAAYLVVAWLVIQVAATLAPQMGLPDWTPRMVSLVMMLGFPVALVLAWVFEVTPEGLKAEPAATGNKRVYAAAAVLAALAVGWFLRGDLPGVRSSSERPRLAVLPLSNFSPDPANAFFADGLHDDMLTALSRMQGVDVISRTTMQSFKDSKLTLAEIAAKIGATQVLEGSVRRDATTVRLTVQLIDAANDNHLWAETYDRPLKDALTLQNEVAQGVAKALKVTVDSAGTETPATTVPAAYDLYLKTRLLNGPEERANALNLLSAALELDPKFTLARAARARLACHVVWFDDTRRKELEAQARADIQQSRGERAGLLEIEVAEAYCVYYLDRDYAAALGRADSVLARDANQLDALRLRAWVLRRLGRPEEGVAALRHRLALEPNDRTAVTDVSEQLTSMRRHRQAVELFDSLPADLAERWRLQRMRALEVYRLTGDKALLVSTIEGLAGRVPDEELQRWRAGVAEQMAGPTSEKLVRYAGKATQWTTVWHDLRLPGAIELAVDAEYIGDLAQRDRFLAQADAMLASLPAAMLAQPRMRVQQAWLLALRGESARAIAEVERALAEYPRDKDALEFPKIQLDAAFVLARAGAKVEAVELLEQNDAAPLRAVPRVDIRDDPYLRKWLGAEPRYQALIKKIEAGFEKL